MEEAIGQAQFTWNLYQQLNRENQDKNLIFSPLSIYVALSILQLGAKETTDEKLRSILKMTSSTPPEFHSWLKKTLENLTHNSEDLKLHFADKVCLQKGIPILAEFENALTNIYTAQITHYDFTSNKFKICDEINEWIKQQTLGKITKLLSPAFVEPDTLFVLITAIYMKAKWNKQFLPQKTKPHPFNSGNRVFKVEMMQQTANFKYAQNDALKCRMLQLPYLENSISMYIILPDDLKEFESEFTYINMLELIDSLNNSFVNVKIPKFDVEASYSLKDTLSNLGLEELFSEETANFSGVSPANKIYLSRFIHKSMLEVTEVGTEAAAASTVLARNVRSLREFEVEFVVDRPFVYFVRDDRSGIVLFFGKFVQPKVEYETKKTEL